LVDTDHASLTQTGKNLASMSLVRAAPGDQPATDWLARHTYNIDELRPSNQRLAEIFEADQAIRKTDNPNAQDWLASDQARRTETAELLRRAQLHTAIDFWRAAFIFQHGGAPGDYLLAHTLALISVKKGYPEAVWIAAATLDRYLQAMKQSQIYGTQYRWTADAPDVSQEPFDKDLISDALRAELGVPPLDAQKANGAILKPMAKSMQKDEIKH